MRRHTAQIQTEILPQSYRSSHRTPVALAARPSCSPSSPLSVTGSAPTTQWIWLHSAWFSLLVIEQTLDSGQNRDTGFILCIQVQKLNTNGVRETEMDGKLSYLCHFWWQEGALCPNWPTQGIQMFCCWDLRVKQWKCWCCYDTGPDIADAFYMQIAISYISLYKKLMEPQWLWGRNLSL